VADRSTYAVCTEENMTTDCCWWIRTKPGRPATNTSFNTSDIQTDRSNTLKCRMNHSLRSRSEHSVVSEKSLCTTTDCSYC